MGTGFRKNRNSMKKSFLNTASKLIDDLQKENEALKTDPETAIGQIIPQFREIVSQNKKLSVLAAAFIKSQGGEIIVNKADMESFEGYNLSIKWELPEGVTDPKTAESYKFSYIALKQDESEPTPAEAGYLYQPEAVSDDSADRVIEEKCEAGELPPLSSINLYDDPDFVPPCCTEGKCGTDACEDQCLGIEIEPEEGVFSGCSGDGGDCPECGE